MVKADSIEKQQVILGKADIVIIACGYGSN